MSRLYCVVIINRLNSLLCMNNALSCAIIEYGRDVISISESMQNRSAFSFIKAEFHWTINHFACTVLLLLL